VILVDVNLLVYATVEEYVQHAAARAWLEERLAGPYGVALPWATLTGYARVVSNPRILERPMPLGRAWDQVEEWLALDVTFTPEPTARHREVLAGLLPAVGNRANLVADAHLAALAMEYGLTLCSTDADFARFPGLRWENPLAKS
jgi:toxin-antitoxin system PIN domain toxin